MTEKIRPAVRQPQQSDPSLRAEAEAELSDKVVRAPDPGGVRVESVVDAVSVSQGGKPGLSFDAVQAAGFRAMHGEPNRLGKPARSSPAEEALATFQRTRVAWKEAYMEQRRTPGQQSQTAFAEAEEAHNEAKRGLIRLGLMSPE